MVKDRERNGRGLKDTGPIPVKKTGTKYWTTTSLFTSPVQVRYRLFLKIWSSTGLFIQDRYGPVQDQYKPGLVQVHTGPFQEIPGISEKNTAPGWAATTGTIKGPEQYLSETNGTVKGAER